MAKVVLLKIQGKKVTVTEAAYKSSKPVYDEMGAVLANPKEILAHEGVKEEKPPKAKEVKAKVIKD